jgi:hypothetical protein
MKRIAVVSALAFAPALAHADQVFLKGGGEIKGEVVERNADAIVVEVGPGRLTLPMTRVARVVSSTTDLAVYRTRAAALAGRDVAGWLSLAAWAHSRDLATQAREAYEHVLAVDPENSAAHLALGHVRMDERWLSLEDANRARGLVEFEGLWLSPDEREAVLAERAALAQERHAIREAEARAREAEARVREAEARARTAELDARQAEEPVGGGIPYPFVYGPFAPFNPFPPPLIVPVEPPPPPPPVAVRPVREPRGGMVTDVRKARHRDRNHRHRPDKRDKP